MSHVKQSLVSAALLGSLGLLLVVPVNAAMTESFEAPTDGTLINNVADWRGPATASSSPQSDVTVRLNSLSQSSTNVGTVPGLGYAGYGASQGLEFNFQDYALRTLGAGEIETTTGTATVEMKVRMGNLFQDATGANNTAIGNHRFVLYIGQGMSWDGTAETVGTGGSVALAVEFWYVGANGSSSINVSKDGVDGFNPNSATDDFTQLADTSWAFNTWYTVRLSNIIKDEVNADYGTATLDIFESATPSNVLVSGATVYAHPGVSTFSGSFDQIDTIGFRSVGGNGLTSVDDLVVAVPEPASLALLALAGACVLRRKA